VHDHDGPFPGGGQTNQRTETKGNDQMSDEQRKMAEDFIDAKKKKGRFLLGGPGYLQTFAEGGADDDLDNSDDDDADDDSDDDDDDAGGGSGDDQTDIDFEYTRGSIDQIMTANKLDFNQLLKDNPELKKAYTDRFNKNMSKRLDKFKDVDVDEYNDLKKRAGEGKLEGDAKTWKDKHDALQVQIKESSQQTAIQSTAIDMGLDKEQIAFVTSMIKTKNLELDDENEWTGIEDEIERIQEKFPRMFATASGDDDDKQDGKKSGSKYNPGKKKSNGGKSDVDPKERGRQRALERHKLNTK
jgi:hypothetical protein